MDVIHAAAGLNDLRIPPSNRLHQLKDDLKGYWSVSINDQYRIIFRWVDGNAEDVEITDYH